MRNRRILALIAALLVAAVLQSTVASHPLLLRARIDLVLLLVVTYSVLQGVGEGLLAGLIGGLIVDVLSSVPFGAATMGMGIVGLLTGLGKANIYRANILIPLVAVFLATVFYHAFLLLSLQANDRTVEWVSTLALQTIPGAAVNALLSPLAFFTIRKLVFPDEGRERFQW